MSENIKNLVAFDASRFNYGQLIINAAPSAWTKIRYDREGEGYALEDLDELASPVVVASLAANSFAYGNYAGKLLIDKACILSAPTLIIAEESMRSRLVVFDSAFFIPRIPGKVTSKLNDWFATL
jgi:hypothetical protein